jgi:hypothetical protein
MSIIVFILSQKIFIKLNCTLHSHFQLSCISKCLRIRALGSQNIRKCYFWVQSQSLPIVAYSTEYRDNLGRLTQRPKSQRQNSFSPTRNFIEDDIFFHCDFHLAGIESSRLSNLFFSSLGPVIQGSKNPAYGIIVDSSCHQLFLNAENSSKKFCTI